MFTRNKIFSWLLAACILFPSLSIASTSVVRSSRRQVDTKSISTNANNTTVSVGLFRVTGSVYVYKLYGVVTTVLSSNQTAAHWRLEDGTNTPAVSLAAGTTVSSATVGALISRTGLAATALSLSNGDQARVLDANSAGNDGLSSFMIIQKNGTNSDLVYRYSTTNAPATGAIQFFMEWEPLSAGATVTAL